MNTSDNMGINNQIYLNTNVMIILKIHNKNKKIVIIPLLNLVDNLQERTFDAKLKRCNFFVFGNHNFC